eukprot:2616847-Prymnesium_polylepis.2
MKIFLSFVAAGKTRLYTRGGVVFFYNSVLPARVRTTLMRDVRVFVSSKKVYQLIRLRVRAGPRGSVRARGGGPLDPRGPPLGGPKGIFRCLSAQIGIIQVKVDGLE